MSEFNLNWYGMSDPAILEQMGKFIQKSRLQSNKTQQEIADAAGVNRSTLVQLEKGKGVNMLSFIQILRALNKLEVLTVFEIKQEISPLYLAEMEMKMRKRARKPSTEENSMNKSSW
jgi:transcriptional regulator with XRE-family HTH domain